ncbi:MAG TPA: DUF1538 domain-containing protein [Bacilli bacterium]|nr:DUF1538 domain-containing protein [Bacilli bacterium]HPS19113.1 DUF1538 domain-containing protein [Bacilli bacterium]
MKFLRTLKDVFVSSLPLLAVIVLVAVFLYPVTNPVQICQLVIGYTGMVIGQAIFLVGLDFSLLPIGKFVGNSLAKFNKIAFVLMFAFLFSLLATIAEPGIAVLAAQVTQVTSASINSALFIFVVSFGLGVMAALAVYRLVKNISMKKIFFWFYLALIVIVFFVPENFQALGFDASGAATGAISVPFVLALGAGFSHTVGKHRTEDSFGIVGIAAIGPIITVYVYGLIVGNVPTIAYDPGNVTLAGSLLKNLGPVALAVFPIVIGFFIYQAFTIKLPKKKIGQMAIASLVVFIGLYIFIFATDYGLAFAGSHIGSSFMETTESKMWLLPIAFVLGFAITLSEPSVVVFSEQVEDLTNGTISKNLIKFALAGSVGLASFLGVVKVITNISILWFIVPLYALAIALIFFTPTLFVGLAFDGGTVSAGAVTSAFLTPMMLGASTALGVQDPQAYDNVLTSGLGIIAFISVMPRIIVQIIGIIYDRKSRKQIVAYEDIEYDTSKNIEKEGSANGK